MPHEFIGKADWKTNDAWTSSWLWAEIPCYIWKLYTSFLAVFSCSMMELLVLRVFFFFFFSFFLFSFVFLWKGINTFSNEAENEKQVLDYLSPSPESCLSSLGDKRRRGAVSATSGWVTMKLQMMLLCYDNTLWGNKPHNLPRGFKLGIRLMTTHYRHCLLL